MTPNRLTFSNWNNALQKTLPNPAEDYFDEILNENEERADENSENEERKLKELLKGTSIWNNNCQVLLFKAWLMFTKCRADDIVGNLETEQYLQEHERKNLFC